MKIKPEIELEKKGKKEIRIGLTCSLALAAPVIIYLAWQLVDLVLRLFHVE